MRMIKLNKITADRGAPDPYHDTDEPGENGSENAEPQIVTTPVTINVAAIRCFYPRKDNRPGTRITFTDGGGYAVMEAYSAINDLIGDLV